MATIQGIAQQQQQQQHCIWRAGCETWGRNQLAALWQNAHNNTNASQTSLCRKHLHHISAVVSNSNFSKSAASFSGTAFDVSAKKAITPVLCALAPAVCIFQKERRPCFKYCLGLGSGSINQSCLIIGVGPFWLVHFLQLFLEIIFNLACNPSKTMQKLP